jgi:hypothetical protein
MKKTFLLRKTFTINSPNSVFVNRQKLVSEIKIPVPLAWGKSPDTFLESFRSRMHQYYVNSNIFYGKVSKHNFQIYRFVEGRSSLTAYGRFEEISTGTLIHITLDMTFNLIIGFLPCLIIIHDAPVSSHTLNPIAAKILFSTILMSVLFLYQRKLFQDELSFYRTRLVEIFVNRTDFRWPL